MSSPGRILQVLVASFIFAISAHAADLPEIRAGSDLDFRPWSFTDKDGRPTGFGVELLRAVAEKATLRLRITPGEWDKVWNGLLAGEIDVLPVVARTPSREELVEFSLPHTETFDAFFVRAGQPLIKDLAAAAGKEIVVVRSDAANHQLVAREFPGKIVPVDSISEGLRLIAAGKHDAMLCSRLIGVLERDQAGITGVTDGPMIPDYKRVFCFGVRKGNTELVERLNQGLRLVQADGTYDRLYRKWLGIPSAPQPVWWDYFWRVVAIVGMLILLAGTLAIGRKVLQLESQPLQAMAVQPRRNSVEVWGYAMAPLAVAAAFMARGGLMAWVGPALPPFLLFYPPIMVVALIAGFGPGSVATVLSAVVVNIWLSEPIGRWSLAPVNQLSLAIFSFNGLLMCALAQLYRRARSKAALFQRDVAVRESEERFRLFMDNSPTVAWVKDEEGRYVYISRALEKRFGVQTTDWRGKTDAEVWPPEIGAAFRKSDLAAMASDQATQATEKALNPDGSTCYWLTTKFPFRDAAGRRYVAGIGLDITEHRAAEKALERQSATLAAINRVLELGLGQYTEEEMCQTCLGVVEQATESQVSFICEIGSDGLLHNLSISNPAWDACNMYDPRGQRKPAGSFHVRGVYGRVFTDGASLMVNDPSSHPDRIGLPPGHPPLTAFLGVPLMREDKTVGLVAVGNRTGGYRIEDQQTLEAMAPAIVEALDRKRAEEALASAHRQTQSIIDSTPDIDHVFDLEQRFVHGKYRPRRFAQLHAGTVHRKETSRVHAQGGRRTA